MSEQQDERELRVPHWRWPLIVLLVVFVAYPMSLGPIYAGFKMGWIPDGLFAWLVSGPYRPMDQLFHDGVDAKCTISVLYSRYIEFWWMVSEP